MRVIALKCSPELNSILAENQHNLTCLSLCCSVLSSLQVSELAATSHNDCAWRNIMPIS